MKILYICTHNRCRSILSEAITRHLAQGRLQAFSAGSEPSGVVHPLSLKYLAEKGIPTHGLKSQSLGELASVQPDIVVTVCDSAAESCSVWFGDAAKVHWGLPDPSQQKGSEDVIREAFMSVMHIIEQNIQKLLDLNLGDLPKEKHQQALNNLTRSSHYGSI
ncbi:arsenate reductase ArsC [Marinagarivorans algicola]|uniref:arsenate reductase ArsC n=1 Tax=Marinagarivorans algicola TaxID=1513270 RepID=UPI0006B5849F|nr:arsenate reductase ArsC [Marinagarivorans algicola]